MTGPVQIPERQEQFKLNEVCKLANVQPYMLRFWGTEFAQLEADKSGTGQRLYSRDQVELIVEIRRLLFDEGLTIAGARKRINSGETPAAAAPEPAPSDEPAAKPATKARRAPSRRAKGPAKAKGEAGAAASEVDNDDPERVQRLRSTLRHVRDELAGIVAQLQPEE